MSTTQELAPDIVQGIALVGRVVTIPGMAGQFKVHSVEGCDWYTFDRDGATVVDTAMPPARWITFPIATIIPSGCRIGQGFSETIAVDQIRVGVNLDK